ncbi:MAG TPA: acyl-CoA dehydrogenase family protein [Terriglobales bacterium]|nr:acyl-CoA dehydrogenase family protein [Terriglobales bacterium]
MNYDSALKTNVPIPEPDLTPTVIVERAKALRPMVRAEAAEAEKRGYYSQALHDEFVKAGFYRMLQPRKFGGYEFDIPTFYKVMLEISTGDPGIGWCLCLGSGHALQVGSYYTEEAQGKIFGPEGHFISPLSATGTSPNCKAIPVKGGYRVSGKWRYCSGVPYSTHFMGLAKVPLDGGKTKTILVVVPREDFKMLDDWGSILGFRASGSNSVVIEDAVIPENFTTDLLFSDNIAGGSPGSRAHGNTMYGGVFLGFAPGELACPNVGAARASLEEFERIIKTTRPRYAPSMLKYEHHDWQRIFGMALSMNQAAEAILMRAGELYMEYARANVEGTRPFTLGDALQLQGMYHQAIRLSWESGVETFRASSSTSAQDGEPMQRFFRDLATFKNNATHQADFVSPRIAQTYFGLPLAEFDL